ncbi:MAG: MgtC/SapB family protein [Candidatus Pacearchaeota archaeon]|jgi:putative Mg2+ transporter-C (MgtC) family protein
MIEGYLVDVNVRFFFSLLLCTIAGFLIGLERESRGKDAGISTHIFVISGAMLFTYMSVLTETSDPRIAAQIVTGIGFLGAGLILKEGERVINLTTAASMWFSGGLGMAIGFGYYSIAAIGTVIAVFVPRFPHIHKESPESVNYRTKKKH